MKLSSYPLVDNFTIPFEGDYHDGTIVLLPYREDTWTNGGMDAIPVFLDIVKCISFHEKVFLVIDPKIEMSIVEMFQLKNVEILRIPYNDSWARDNTLVFVSDGFKTRAVDFGFNAWGGSFDGLYDDYEEDNLLGEAIAKKLDYDYYSLKNFILEGGSIHTNGKQTLLVTKACLLSKGRNPNLNQQEIEDILKKYLGQKKVIWLDNGIVDDETNEHIDNFACFLDETTVLLADCNNKNDPQYEISKKAYEILKNETTWDKKPLKIITIPVPEPCLRLSSLEASKIRGSKGSKERKSMDRLAASYVNFYQGKDFLLLPQFNVSEDDEAYNILKKFYKNKTIYRIYSRQILLSGGNIHCVTMQIPKGDIYED